MKSFLNQQLTEKLLFGIELHLVEVLSVVQDFFPRATSSLPVPQTLPFVKTCSHLSERHAIVNFQLAEFCCRKLRTLLYTKSRDDGLRTKSGYSKTTVEASKLFVKFALRLSVIQLFPLTNSFNSGIILLATCRPMRCAF